MIDFDSELGVTCDILLGNSLVCDNLYISVDRIIWWGMRRNIFNTIVVITIPSNESLNNAYDVLETI
jgi:hypothetical protein